MTKLQWYKTVINLTNTFLFMFSGLYFIYQLFLNYLVLLDDTLENLLRCLVTFLPYVYYIII